MDKEKFHIPMPDELIIQREVSKIVAVGLKKRVSFPAYLKKMLQEVGVKQLFQDRWQLVSILFTTMAAVVVYVILTQPANLEIHDIYAYIFLISPILFLTFSLYSYGNKFWNTTFEVEMTCKYNVYQIAAFRMLVFSIAAILFNAAGIAVIGRLTEIEFIRAFMISTTALFTFAILFLYTLMIRRSFVAGAAVLLGWVFVNLLFLYVNNQFYIQFLTNMSLVVYGLVLSVSIYFYTKYLKKLIQYKQTEGAF